MELQQSDTTTAITKTDLAVLLASYLDVGSFKTAPDFIGVLEQLKHNMIEGGATSVISINDVALDGTMGSTGCTIVPKAGSVQYSGTASLT
jgi:hypothetical protein